jgi:hypothetical protein
MPRRRPRRRRPRRAPAISARPAVRPAPARPAVPSRPRLRTAPAPEPTAEAASRDLEARLLALARALGGVAAAAEASPAPALRALLPARPEGGAGDETRTLAISWAREQARLALEEALARVAPGGRRAAPRVPLPLLAWLLVSATEAFPTEPADGLGERLAALADLIAAAGGPRRW